MRLVPYHKEIIAICTLALCSCMHAHAQSRLNFGLTRPQLENTLPKTKAAFDKPQPAKKMQISPSPVPIANQVFSLNNGWELADGESVMANSQSVHAENYNTAKWYNATVPGTVLTTLVNQGVYSDPYIGLNNMAIPDTLCRKDWWYRLAFETPKSNAGKLAWLQFNGINYKAQIWLNGKLIGTINGAFKRGIFEVSQYLKAAGKNILAVHILPPPNPGIPHEQSAIAGMGPNGGQLALDGPTFMSSEGWDWVPGIRDRNIGIWQDVQLKYTGAVSIIDPQVITDLPLPDTSVAYVTVKATLKNNSNAIQTIVLKGSIESAVFSSTVTLNPKEEKLVVMDAKNNAALQMKQPKLWWPNGYGLPSLYTLKLTALNGKSLSDEVSTRFGIREFSYELMADAPDKPKWRFEYSPTNMLQKLPLLDNVKRRDVGKRIFIPTLRQEIDTKDFISLDDTTNPYLVIKVNGVKVFCKGGNWGMDDGMKRVERSRLEPAFKLHREANYNMVRNWTGESTESVFYDLADEYGMLVWNDFWLSTEGYNLAPNDQQLFLANTLDAIKRFRNHASIAIWCPRNEGYAPVGIEDELAMQLATEDGTRHYIGNSREINLRQSGDWHYVENYKEYFTRYAEGFSTEIGTFSVPVASTIRKFIKPEDQWPISDAWHYHDLHSNNQNLPGYLKAVDSLFGKATSLDDFNKKVQLINYETHRAIFESWNSKLWQNGSGVLLWMTHPAWPSMIWQTYSWDYETHGSYYGAKKACEPVHVQMNLHDNKVIVANASQHSYKGVTVSIQLIDLAGKEIFRKRFVTDVAANQKTDVWQFTNDALEGIALPDVYLIRLAVHNNDVVLSENAYWKNTAKDFTAFNQLPLVTLSGKTVLQANGSVMVELHNNSQTPAIGIKLNLVDDKNTILLPAYFSDGYFTLMPGEKKQISIQHAFGKTGTKVKTDGYNIHSSYISLQ